MTISIELALALLSIVFIPVIVWSTWMTFQIKAVVQELKMLRSLQDGLHECIHGLTNAVNDLTHYTRWLAKRTTGEEPEPPINHNRAQK